MPTKPSHIVATLLVVAVGLTAEPASAENWVQVDGGWVIDLDSLVWEGSRVYYDERVSAAMLPTFKHRVDCSQNLSGDFVVETQDSYFEGGRIVYNGNWQADTLNSNTMSANTARYACSNK